MHAYATAVSVSNLICKSVTVSHMVTKNFAGFSIRVDSVWCTCSQVGRVEELLHELVERESAKPGPSSSNTSSAYAAGFSKGCTTTMFLV